MADDLELSTWQWRLLGLQRRHGSRAVVLVITTVSIVLSLALTAATLVLSGAPGDMFAWAMAIAFVVPALVAPVATALVTRLGDALADAHDRLHALAHVDGLTGAATRRAFFTEAEATLRNRRGPGVVVVGMVDADAFKSLNDSCGHAAGDRALVDLATAVRGWLGDDGVLGRLGGDEFAFVRRLPAHMADDELAALEQRCRRLGSVGDRTVTASVGAVEAEDREDLHDALARADRALYEAKRRRATAARARPATPYRRASRNMALTES